MGAEESKLHSKHERMKRDKYAKEDYYRYQYTPRSYENQYANNWEKENFDSQDRTSRDKQRYYYDKTTDREKRHHEKENRERRRRHYSDDRSTSDTRYDAKSSHRERVRSDDRDSRSKSKEKSEKRKKESFRLNSEKKQENKTHKETKKRKSSPEAKSPSPDGRNKTEKREKASTSCLPNVSQVRRRKKKADLEKHKRAHRSAPDLSNDEMSRVGAWLNSNSFSPETPAWHPALSYSYGTLPGAFSLPPPPDGGGKPRPIVDGMGSPIGTIYPDGSFVPNNTTGSLGRQGNLEAPASFRYSMPPFYQFPYMPYYFPPLHPYNYHRHPAEAEVFSNERQKLTNRSHSDNHLDAIGNTQAIEPVYATVTKVKKKLQKQSNPSSSTFPRESSRMQVSVSSHPSSVLAQAGEYYSDIQETKHSLETMFTYQANRQISVDNVRHAEIGPIKSPPLSGEEESDFSGEDSSLTYSSTNDVELDSNEANPLSETTKSSNRSDQLKSSNLHFFQPISKHEVFIDGNPVDTSKKQSKKHQAAQNRDSRAQPTVRLGEQESIVATSFLVEGEKVFCLTKSKKALPQAVASTKSKRPKTSKITVVTTKPQQEITKKSKSEKRNSGTWFGLTGSPTPTKSASRDLPEASNKPAVTSQFSLTSSSSSSLSSRGPSRKSDSSVSFELNNVLSESKSPTISLKFPVTVSPRSSITAMPKLPPNKKSPKPKPRISSIMPLPDAAKFKSDSKDASVQTLQSIPKTESEKVGYVSDSSDSEPLMRDEDHSITRKLIRIDSRDSFTMKRRLRYHRRSSSLTDKLVSRHDSMEKSSTLPLTPRSDSHLSDLQTPFDSNLYSSSKLRTSTSNLTEPYVDALLHKAKSEEVLKREISRSSEELLSDFSPPRKKETLQERAARILGLNANDLYRAKEKQDRQRAMLFPDLESSHGQKQSTETSSTKVTASKSAQGSISHPAVGSSISRRSNDEEPSESFAVSVTESMLNKVDDQIEIKNVDTSTFSNSSVDVSSISGDSSTSLESSGFSPVPDAEFLIEVSDSVLEETTVPCRVKPQKEIQASPAKEYKLPDDISLNSETLVPKTSSMLSPTSAHASIVANYTNSIYDRVPGPGEISHTSELSDDTTETESLDQSGRFLELAKQKPKDSDSGTSTLEQASGHTLPNEQLKFTSRSNPAHKHRESPVPVATHSAPLTPGEMDIVMQLCGNADDDISVSSYDSPEPSKSTVSRNKADLQKEAIAKSIGFNIANLTPSSNPHPNGKEAKLEKVEDFDIKVFPGASTLPAATPKDDQERRNSDPTFTTTETNSSTTESSPSDVEEVMQSLGLNPEETWLVSL